MTKTRSNIIMKPEGVQHAIGPVDDNLALDAMLLVLEIFAVFQKLGVKRMSATKILQVLYADHRTDWSTFCSGKELNSRRLASLLSVKGIHSHHIRFKRGVKKGYLREPFENYSQLLCSQPLPKDQ